MVHLASGGHYHTAEVTLELYDVDEPAEPLGAEWVFDGHWWVARRTQDPMFVTSLMPDDDDPRIDLIVPIPLGVYEYDTYVAGRDKVRVTPPIPAEVIERWVVRLRPSDMADPHPQVESAISSSRRAYIERGRRSRGAEETTEHPGDRVDPGDAHVSDGLGWVVP